MVFDLLERLRSCVSIVKVIRLNVVYKVFVNYLEATSFLFVSFLIGGLEIGSVCLAQHNMSSLSWDIVHCGFLREVNWS